MPMAAVAVHEPAAAAVAEHKPAVAAMGEVKSDATVLLCRKYRTHQKY